MSDVRQADLFDVGRAVGLAEDAHLAPDPAQLARLAAVQPEALVGQQLVSSHREENPGNTLTLQEARTRCLHSAG